jgi:hypothetical protein
VLAVFEFYASTQLTLFCIFWDIADIFAPFTSPDIDEGSLPFYQLEDLRLPCRSLRTPFHDEARRVF